ncbi:MAG: hypothetical protein IPO27_12395, partial [Bacteroidetes bacterium]|nr:hypothetical protein [Bacteroidota bacterium]
MKKIIFVLLILALVDKLDAQVKQPAPLIISNITLSSPKLITAIDDLICTNLESQPVVITGNAQVEYKAEGEITLLPGFEVSALNQNTEHFFWAHIEPMGNPEAIICYPHKAVNPNDGMVHVNKWEKLELGFKLPDAYKAGVDAFFFHYYNGQSVPADDLNPYADDSLLFKATFKRPDGTSIIKYGFFMRESKWGVNLNSEPEEDLTHVFYDYFWRVRFAPDKDDANIPWTAIMELAAPKSSQITFPPLTFNSLTFICDPPLPDNHGYLTVNQNNNRYLQFEDGTSFFGIGANLCDQRHNYNPALHWNRFLKVDYNNFLQAFNQSAAAGGNFFRMIFLKSLFLPEYEHLGVYDKFINTVPECAPYCISAGWDHNRNGNRQYSAWILDKMLDKAKDTKIYLHLTLEYANNGGAYQMMHWGDNCYARKYLYPTGTFNQNINGIDYFDGPYNSKELFISSNVSDPTNEGVMYFWKRRYKYIMSRWSYSTNIAAFDSFNELESMPGANTSGTMDAFSTCSNNLTPTPFN